MLVYLEGELRTRTWVDENGKKHFRTEIKINDMKLLDAKDKKGSRKRKRSPREYMYHIPVKLIHVSMMHRSTRP